MATVITSIGSKSTTGNAVTGPLTIITGGTGSGTPWTGTVKFSDSAESSKASVGDKLYFENVYYPGSFGGCDGGGTADVIYLITGVSGDTLTVKYMSGAVSTTNPSTISSNSVCSVIAQPYVVRYYSTPATWEAGLNDDDLYSNGDTAKGECHDDTDFNITTDITIDGGGSLSGGSLDTVILSVAAGQRHDGTAKEVGGSGVRFLWGADSVQLHLNEARDAWVEWIDFDVNDRSLFNTSALKISGGSWYSQYENGAVWCLVHDNVGQTTVGGMHHTFGLRTYGAGKFLCNCIVYNMSSKGQEDCYGINTDNQDRVIITNCTVYNIHGFDTTPAPIATAL